MEKKRTLETREERGRWVRKDKQKDSEPLCPRSCESKLTGRNTGMSVNEQRTEKIIDTKCLTSISRSRSLDVANNRKRSKPEKENADNDWLNWTEITQQQKISTDREKEHKTKRDRSESIVELLNPENKWRSKKEAGFQKSKDIAEDWFADFWSHLSCSYLSSSVSQPPLLSQLFSLLCSAWCLVIAHSSATVLVFVFF